MKLSNLFLILLVTIFFIKIITLLINVPLGEIDNAYNIAAYNAIAKKGGNLLTSDFLIQFSEPFVTNRTAGTYGTMGGYVLMTNYGFNIRLPYFVAGIFLLIASYAFYKFYNNDNLKGVILFAYSLFNLRIFSSLMWGQWAFLSAFTFSIIGVYFFKKFLDEHKKEDFIFSLISLFIVLQTHQITVFVALLGMLAILLNMLINKKLTTKQAKLTLIFLFLLILSQIPFLGYYHSLLNTFSDKTTFNISEAFLMNYTTYGYPSWYFHDFFLIWGIGLVLIPFGVIKGFKEKKYTFILWFVFVWVLSRHSLIPFTHEQSRISAAVPFIASLLCGEGFDFLGGKNKTLRITLLIISLSLMMYFILPSSFIFHLNPDMVDVFSWVRNNLNNAYLTTCFPIRESDAWSFTSICDNKVFVPRFKNNSLIITNYSDLRGRYNITHIICYLTNDKNIVYNNKRFEVIKI